MSEFVASDPSQAAVYWQARALQAEQELLEVRLLIATLPAGCLGMEVTSYVVYGNGTRQLTLKPRETTRSENATLSEADAWAQAREDGLT